MGFENQDDLTPAQVAELLGIPSSTLRTYATEFGRLLSRGAQGDPATAGRAFRHRRYTRDDLVLLRRAQALLETGLNYRLALAQLADQSLLYKGGVSRETNGEPRETARRSRPGTATARGRRSSDRPAASSPKSVPPAAPVPPIAPVPTASPAVPTAPIEPRIERVVETVVDSSATDAVERLRPLVERVVDQLEALDARVASIDSQLDALRVEVGRIRREDAGASARRTGWLQRLLRGAVDRSSSDS